MVTILTHSPNLDAEPAPNLVPDDILREWALGTPGMARGEFTDQEIAALAMNLPDICGELLAWRALDRAPATAMAAE